MKVTLSAKLLSLLLVSATHAGSPFTLLLTEDFNSDGEGSRYTSSSFDDGGSDYFERVSANPDPRQLGGYNFVAPQGGSYWTSEDIDEGGAPNPLGDHGIVRLNDLNVAGFSGLQVRIFLATTQTTRFDIEDIIEVQVAADGNSGGATLTAGTYTTIGRFIGNAPDIFGSVEMKQDADLDGVVFGDGDDAASPTLNNTMQEFVFPVPFTATNLSVQVRIEQNGGSEEIAFDHIRIEGFVSTNNAPVLAGIEGPAIVFTEGDPPTQLTNTLTVSDADAGDMIESATVQITANYSSLEDQLSIGSVPPGAFAAFDLGTGTLTISGTGSVADYQAALRSVTYQNTDTVNPSTAIRTIQFQVNDGSDNSNFQSRNVQITATIGTATIPHLEDLDTDGEGARYTSSTFNVSNSDFFERTPNPHPGHSGPFTPTAPQGGDLWASEDVASPGNPLGDHGILRLQNLDATGFSNLEVSLYLGELAALSEAGDMIEVQYAFDGDIPANPTDLSSGSYTTIGRFLPDSPDIVTTGPMKLDSDLDGTVFGDADDAASPTLSATMQEFTFAIPATGNDLSIQIRFGQDGGNEELAFDHIQVTGDPVVGTPPTLANIEAAPLTFFEGDPDRPLTTGLTVSDPDATQIASATVQITGNFQPGEDVLGDDGSVPASITVAPFDTGTGTLSLSGSASPADYQAALRAVTYGNTNLTNPSAATRTVAFQAIDGDGNPSNTQARGIDVVPSIDPGSIPLVETFDTDGNGVRYTAGSFNTGALESFFERVTANPDPRHDAPGFTGFTFTPPQGGAYFASEDIEHPANPLGDHGIIRLRDLDVTGATGIKVRLYLAESAPNGEGPDDKIEIQFAMDGNSGGTDLTAGTYTTIGRFVPDSPNEFTTGPMTLDRDLDGVTNGDAVDDAPAAALGTTMQEFEFDIPATGNLLSVQIRVEQNGGNEELAIDQITVVAPLPGPVVVTTDADEDDGNPGPLSGAGTSLREALLAANLAPGPDVINFSDGSGGTTNFLTGFNTIQIAGLGQLQITDDLTINGPGSNRLTIDAENTVRGIDINTATVVDLSGFTIENGNAGAANGGGINIISPAGVNVTMNDVDVRDSSASDGGGIFINSSSGTFTFSDLELTGNNAASLVGGLWIQTQTAGISANRITVDDNQAGAQVGGVVFQLFSGGSLVIRDSTISNNLCTGSNMGGMFLQGAAASPMTIVNSTFSGNRTDGSAAGAMWLNSGPVAIINSTITGNSADAPGALGGGIFNTGATVTVNNSIIAGNSAATDPDVRGTFASNGFNFIGDPGASAGFGADKTFASTGTTLTDVLDPVLTNFGGPTLVHRLRLGSPAIDMGNTPDAVDENLAPLATDQRGPGFPRALGATVDIGAFESSPPNVVTSAADSGAGSLRQAVGTALNGGFVTFDPGLDGQTIGLSTAISISRGLTVDASALPRGVTVSGGGTTRVLNVSSSSPVDIHKLTIADGRSSIGGGIFTSGNLTLEDCHLTRNLADVLGGAIYQSSGNLAIRRSTISANEATSSGGGGIRSIGTSTILDVTNSTIVGNRAGFGGGIFAQLGTTNLSYTTVAGNTGTNGSGGLVLSIGTATIGNSIIAANKAQGTPDADIGGSGANLTVLGQNLVGNNSGPYSSFFPPDGVLIGKPLAPVDPHLAPLSEYGGCTPTMQPLALSPAFDAGIASGSDPATDQRGLPRIVAGAPDLGAVESGFPITVLNTNDSGPGSLRQAILDAAVTPAPRIYFDSGVFPATITLSSPLLVTGGRHVFIDASNLPGPVVLDGGGSTQVMDVQAGSIAGLQQLTLTGGRAPDGGAARVNGGILAVNSSTIAGNTTTFGSGAGIILFSGGSVSLNDSLVADNAIAPTNVGGGIISFFGDVTAVNSTFTGNQAGGGAAIWVQGASALRLVHTTITGNTGAEAVVSFGTNTIENTVIAANSATNLAGAGTTTFRGSNFLAGDPLLAPLNDFGGPTFTMPPLPGSPVIAGATLLSTTPCADQRGFARPHGPFPDIGAAEAYAFSLFPLVDTDGDGIDDRLEAAYPHLTVGVDDSAVDFDRDGRTDATELGDMTNPLDINDHIMITSFVPTGAFDPVSNPLFNVTVNTFPGLSYELEAHTTGVTGFSMLPGTGFTATGFGQTQQVLLDPNTDFIRARRTP